MPKVSDSDITSQQIEPDTPRPSSPAKHSGLRTYTKFTQPQSMRYGLTAAAVVVVALLGFLSGVHYQKGKNLTTMASSVAARNGANGFAAGGFGGRGGARSGGFGIVTTVSATSISIQDQRTSTTKTYGVTSTTIITDNGSTVDYTDIKSGDTVIVRAGSTSSTNATSILVNPSAGGFGGGPADQSSGQSNQTDSSGSTINSGTSTI